MERLEGSLVKKSHFYRNARTDVAGPLDGVTVVEATTRAVANSIHRLRRFNGIAYPSCSGVPGSVHDMRKGGVWTGAGGSD